MRYIAGVDIGNSTTEACIAEENFGRLKFLASASVATTGLKGTPENTQGIKHVLSEALDKAGLNLQSLSVIRLNEAAPVIGDTAMETIRATVITDSAMIGHNPDTPAGGGCATGTLIKIEELNALKNINNPIDIKDTCALNNPLDQFIVTIPKEFSYAEAASIINCYADSIQISGLILEQNEAVLVWNRLNKKIPVIDEVTGINKIPAGRLAAIEVALPGETIKVLSNPYGIATIFGLDAEDTKKIAMIAKSLIGSRSGIVIKSPLARVTQETINAGTVIFLGTRQTKADIDSGADEIMKQREEAGELSDIFGKKDTNIGNMLSKITATMSFLTGEDIHITDLFAVDTFVPVTIAGGLAGETCPEKAVAVAAMVKAGRLPMNKIAEKLSKETGTKTLITGVEAVMAVLGALTTPGTGLPIAVLDLGGGSVDAAIMDESGVVRSTHFAGAGQLVTLIIASELSIDRKLAEQIKRWPLAKVESLFHLRLESGNIIFLDKPLSAGFFGHNILMTGSDYINTGIKLPMERIADIRTTAKRRVFVKNALRALKEIAPFGKLSDIASVVLVGGSALDFEIPDMIAGELSNYSIVCGCANVRGIEGPRNAVATGLVMS